MITADEARFFSKNGNSLAYEISKVENKIILFAAAKQVEVVVVPSFQDRIIQLLKLKGFEVSHMTPFKLLITWK